MNPDPLTGPDLGLNGYLTPKKKILLLFTQPHVISNLHFFNGTQMDLVTFTFIVWLKKERKLIPSTEEIVIQVSNNLRVSKLLFWVNYPFNWLIHFNNSRLIHILSDYAGPKNVRIWKIHLKFNFPFLICTLKTLKWSWSQFLTALVAALACSLVGLCRHCRHVNLISCICVVH